MPLVPPFVIGAYCEEFADNGGCEQLMTSSADGKCSCSCSDGFVLSKDDRTCEPGWCSRCSVLVFCEARWIEWSFEIRVNHVEAPLLFLVPSWMRIFSHVLTYSWCRLIVCENQLALVWILPQNQTRDFTDWGWYQKKTVRWYTRA